MRCSACPVSCGQNREKAAGYCGVQGLIIAKYYLHPFEEPPVSYKNGSGTVFFCGCSLKCVFCQNYELSRVQRGKRVSTKDLADIFKELEDKGADNINLVTPDHVSDYIAEALALYKPAIPVVYNSGGYCKVESLKRIDPYVDVYLPDVKFVSPFLSERYTGRADYFEYAKEAVAFMAQKPVVFENGKLLSGILARHLVLPAASSDSMQVLDFLKSVLPEEAPVSLMRQYTPMGEIEGYPELGRKITAREYRRVCDYALSLGFKTIYTQDKSSAEKSFIPKWDY